MQFVYMLCGLPGSGKTTYAKKIENQECIRLTLDERLFQLFGKEFSYSEYFKYEMLIEKRLLKDMKQYLSQGKSVILDWGFWQKKYSKKKVYDYKPFQIFLGLSQSYLNTIHSIYDAIQDIDKVLGKKYAQLINLKLWFRINIDLRNIFHHTESPLLRVVNNKVVFTFGRLPRYPKYFKKGMKDRTGKYHVELDCKNLEEDMLKFLNLWAMRYLKLIDKKTYLDTITGFHKNGKAKIKKVQLKTLIK